jgi:hypothetical protein
MFLVFIHLNSYGKFIVISNFKAQIEGNRVEVVYMYDENLINPKRRFKI